MTEKKEGMTRARQSRGEGCETSETRRPGSAYTLLTTIVHGERNTTVALSSSSVPWFRARDPFRRSRATAIGHFASGQWGLWPSDTAPHAWPRDPCETRVRGGAFRSRRRNNAVSSVRHRCGTRAVQRPPVFAAPRSSPVVRDARHNVASRAQQPCNRPSSRVCA